ncbi:hypothetical protein OIU34_12730 [Pararhizobium sp. BT-229]|uniref:hypothetical protein n=1 Tax=Pararhizobium sp. BT-229 TaxID=2986923 RepID=UPI0021F79D16|nr:hypothetical protein [Pararhizobium sp. BT-229]MCV9962766.1 hypothetical protein [Pararhizobium sp. BT-229]
MPSVTRRFENSMRNGMSGWARSQPIVVRALLFLPCLLEYLLFCVVCLFAMGALVFLMGLAWIFRLDPERPASLR